MSDNTRQARTLLFKIGDRVRLHNNHPSHTDEVGVIRGATFSPARQQIYFVDWENWNIDMLFWFETELELVESADAVGRERVSGAGITDAMVERAVLAFLYAKDDDGEHIGVSSCFMPTHWMREIQHVPNWNTPSAVAAENESNRRFEHRIRLAMRSALEDAIALLTAAPAECETGGAE